MPEPTVTSLYSVQMFSQGKLVGTWDRVEDIPADVWGRYAFSHELRRVKKQPEKCESPERCREIGHGVCGFPFPESEAD